MLSKLRKSFSSLFSIYFFSLWLVTSILLSITIFFFYQNIKDVEMKAFKSSVSQSGKDILRHVKEYNSGLVYLHENTDFSHLREIIQRLEELGENPEKIDQKKIKKIAEEGSVSIFFIDSSSTEVLVSSKKAYEGMLMKDLYPRIEDFFYHLKKKDGINIRFSWNFNMKRMRVFAREFTRDKKFLWSVKYRLTSKTPLDKVIKSLKAIYPENTLVDKMGLYTKDLLKVHGFNQLPPPKNLKEVLFEKNCKAPLYCESWVKLKHSKRKEKIHQLIKYVGVRYESKYLGEAVSEMTSDIYRVVLISFFLSLLFSFFLSKILTKAIYQILGVTRKLEKNISFDVNVPEVWNSELNELSTSFNNLLKKLSERKKKNQEMADEIVRIADKERSNISCDLHDSVGQLLVAVSLKISEDDKKGAKEIIRLASEELRSIYHKLEPRFIEDISFQNAVEWYLLRFFSKDFPYKLELELAENFSNDFKMQIYRIIQEIIANAKKHSPRGKFLTIKINQSENHVYLTAQNDMMEDEKKDSVHIGRGIKNIQLRVESLGGELSVNSHSSVFEVKVTFDISTKGE